MPTYTVINMLLHGTSFASSGALALSRPWPPASSTANQLDSRSRRSVLRAQPRLIDHELPHPSTHQALPCPQHASARRAGVSLASQGTANLASLRQAPAFLTCPLASLAKLPPPPPPHHRATRPTAAAHPTQQGHGPRPTRHCLSRDVCV